VQGNVGEAGMWICFAKFAATEASRVLRIDVHSGARLQHELGDEAGDQRDDRQRVEQPIAFSSVLPMSFESPSE
jgi:hypothetical protein